LPKAAILSNEIETDHWVMLLKNDSTAVKVPVQIGLRNQERTEIISPKFKGTDRIVTLETMEWMILKITVPNNE
jgi:hypothetical protein